MTIYHKLNHIILKHKNKWTITIIGIVVIILVGAYNSLIYNDIDYTINWHDDTVGWIVSQGLYTNYNELKRSELPDLIKLNLDAETIKNIRDLKYFTNLEELTINAKNVKSLKTLQRLDKLKKLVVINGDNKTLSDLKRLNVSTLILKNFTLSSIQPLMELNDLSRLEIIDTNIVDATSLRNINSLLYLSLVNVRADKPISLNELGNYKEICLSNVEISNLDILGCCTNLTSLRLENINLSHEEKIIFPDGLKEVTVKYCDLSNLDLFLSLSDLTSLDITGNKVQDISNLVVFNNLKELSLAHNPIYDLRPIECIKNSIKLDLSGINLNKEALDILSKMQFEELFVSKCNISDLNFLIGHDEIKRLDLSYNTIADIETLNLNMCQTELEYLNISWNPIKDLTPLSEWVPNIPHDYPLYYKENSSFEGVELDVSGIELGKIAHEMGIGVVQKIILSRLTARNCDLRDTKIALFQGNLQFLDISGNPIENLYDLDDGLTILKDIIAKDTLISKKTFPPFTKLLTPPGTYGIDAQWKMANDLMYFNGSAVKKEWIRLVIE